MEAVRRNEEPPMCVVCKCDEPSIIVVGCGHTCLCYRCARRVRETFNRCPICRSAELDSNGFLKVKIGYQR
jgi:Zinc finger, C3HC4 type (RING finger)